MFYMMERTAVGVDAANWIGGLPKIPQASWPRSEKAGYPLHFIAQIDLTSIAEPNNMLGLPVSGYLVFFIDTYFEGTAHKYGLQPRVLHIKEKFDFSLPPHDTPRVFGSSFAYVNKFHSEHPVKHFYRMPVNLRLKDWGDYSAWAKGVGAAYNDVFNVSRDGPPFRVAAIQLRQRLQENFRRMPFFGTREREARLVQNLEEKISIIKSLQHLTGGDFQTEALKRGCYFSEKTPKDALESTTRNLDDRLSNMDSFP